MQVGYVEADLRTSPQRGRWSNGVSQGVLLTLLGVVVAVDRSGLVPERAELSHDAAVLSDLVGRTDRDRKELLVIGRGVVVVLVLVTDSVHQVERVGANCSLALVDQADHVGAVGVLPVVIPGRAGHPAAVAPLQGGLVEAPGAGESGFCSQEGGGAIVVLVVRAVAKVGPLRSLDSGAELEVAAVPVGACVADIEVVDVLVSDCVFDATQIDPSLNTIKITGGLIVAAVVLLASPGDGEVARAKSQVL